MMKLGTVTVSQKYGTDLAPGEDATAPRRGGRDGSHGRVPELGR